jgi:hypothetical protein
MQRLKRAMIPMPSLAYDPQGNPNKPWVLMADFIYRSPRYGKTLTARTGYRSDGASFIARDVMTRAWVVHDRATDDPRWDDGTVCTRWQSSTVCYDILREDGYRVIAPVWWIGTWLGGLGKPNWY